MEVIGSRYSSTEMEKEEDTFLFLSYAARQFRTFPKRDGEVEIFCGREREVVADFFLGIGNKKNLIECYKLYISACMVSIWC